MLVRTRDNDGGQSLSRRQGRRQGVLDMLFPPQFADLSLARNLMSALTPVVAEAVAFVPSVELSEKDGNYIIDVALPGFSRADIDIEVSGKELTISGTYERSREDRRTHYSEMQQASFTRTIVLPQEVDADNVTATFQDGILHIVARPVAPISAKHVPIGAGEQQQQDGRSAQAGQAGTTAQQGTSQQSAGAGQAR
jgi:HSP20 family protein